MLVDLPFDSIGFWLFRTSLDREAELIASVQSSDGSLGKKREQRSFRIADGDVSSPEDAQNIHHLRLPSTTQCSLPFVFGDLHNFDHATPTLAA